MYRNRLNYSNRHCHRQSFNTCSEEVPVNVRHEAESNFTILRHELKSTPRCIPIASELHFKTTLDLFKLTFLD